MLRRAHRAPPTADPCRARFCRHGKLRSANTDLSEFAAFSEEQFAVLAPRLAAHAATLHTVRTDLMAIFTRVRALKQRLLEAHPEFRAEAAAEDARREAAMEEARSPAVRPEAASGENLPSSGARAAEAETGPGRRRSSTPDLADACAEVSIVREAT